MKRFWHKERNINYLIGSIVGLCGLAWFVNGVSPESIVMQVAFYAILSIVTFSLGIYIFTSIKEAFLVSIGSVICLFLRSLNLRHPIYVILLVAVLCSINVYYNKRD